MSGTESDGHGVFCIECSYGNYDGPTGLDALNLVAADMEFPTRSRRVGTWVDLTAAILVWSRKWQARYPILWLAGRRTGSFYVTRTRGEDGSRSGRPNRHVGPAALSDIFKKHLPEKPSQHPWEAAGPSWSNCLLHFSGYPALDGERRQARDLAAVSGLAAISGYRKNNDWTRCMALEMLYMKALQDALSHWPLDEAADSVHENLLDSRMASGLVNHLGFEMLTP